jgi:hypothetical protein
MYDAQLGRFISRDPLGTIDGMNLYRAYFVPGGMDPSGNEAVGELGNVIRTLPDKECDSSIRILIRISTFPEYFLLSNQLETEIDFGMVISARSNNCCELAASHFLDAESTARYMTVKSKMIGFKEFEKGPCYCRCKHNGNVECIKYLIEHEAYSRLFFGTKTRAAIARVFVTVCADGSYEVNWDEGSIGDGELSWAGGYSYSNIFGGLNKRMLTSTKVLEQTSCPR